MNSPKTVDEPKAKLDTNETVLRNISPGLLTPEGLASPKAFGPTSDDEGLLSTDRAKLRAPEETYRFRVESLMRPSAGVLGLQVAEVVQVGLEVLEDPVTDEPLNDAHAVIDFRPLSKQEERIAREKLLNFAKERGWLFQPGD